MRWSWKRNIEERLGELEIDKKRLEGDIENVEARVRWLEKFQRQTLCSHPIGNRVVEASNLSAWIEKCTECGKVLGYYYSQADAYKAKERVLSEQMKENKEFLSRLEKND